MRSSRALALLLIASACAGSPAAGPEPAPQRPDEVSAPAESEPALSDSPAAPAETAPAPTPEPEPAPASPPAEPDPNSPCALELRTELDPSAPRWGAATTVRLRVVNVSEAPQDVVIARSCPGADIRVVVGDARFDPTSACAEGMCMRDPPPLRFTLAPGGSRVVGELAGKLGPKLSCMDAELARGEHEVRASARVQSKQRTCARGQTIRL